MPLVSTVGAANANSYGSYAESEAYFIDRYGSSTWWEDDEHQLLLIMACLRMETIDYRGTRATETQALSWPRSSVPKPDLLGLYFADTEIPTQIKHAQFEFAFSLGRQNSVDPDSIKSLAIGNSVKAEFDSSKAIIDTSAASGWLPTEAARLLRGFRLNTSGVPMVRA